jgi:uncharacterized membrane protein
MSRPEREISPSAWQARLPILALAAAGMCIAGYLAAYQMGMLKKVWEPFFNDGSRTVLHSFVSRLLPVPDAALGAFGYGAEIIAGAIGGRERWHNFPAIVIIYGAVVLALAAAALVLICLQTFVIRAGCTLCLTSAGISLIIAWLARDEVIASVAVVREQGFRYSS